MGNTDKKLASNKYIKAGGDKDNDQQLSRIRRKKVTMVYIQSG